MPQHHPDADVPEGVDQLRGCCHSHEEFGDGASVGESGRPLFLIVVDYNKEHHEEADGEGNVAGSVADALGVLGRDGDLVGLVDVGNGEFPILEFVVELYLLIYFLLQL